MEEKQTQTEQAIDQFQLQVSDLLLRHRSLLDVVSKFQESNARTNRAIMKAVTDCGCIKIHADRQPFDDATTIEECKEGFTSHLSGQLCSNCRDIVKSEMGKNLFYLAAMCNLFKIPLSEVIASEQECLNTLGSFHFR
ncbi:DUF1573 domain-containing protein [Mechercharimyces sp. CAU 1602]|uniref:DUF1573 domain-containing protein n=1 Tax=Mechercharimyces sp. CAU 1602 TaxID=2973933 RepID=UPI002162DC95|nr:DUF1573 domain-containing protein [Mechercharimyces sp. CAU 1602]MCS1352506.1 DUF1573 domain-containing protein [Mechercharimyces sp. CAU 1602]